MAVTTFTGSTRLHVMYGPMSRISGKIELLKPTGKIVFLKSVKNP